MNKTLVIVDDDPGVQDVFKLIFERAGYTTIIYTDPKPIFEKSFIQPDLFILDKQLSGVDGLDICRLLKSQDTTRHIPVIMLSASPHIERLALAAGANEFIEKPFRNKVLVATVEKYIGLSGH
ncbi:MAG: mprA 4 [Chitinophagaceae bacterium]|nr:mprA 4 [Chitinophagaceae bacterium]